MYRINSDSPFKVSTRLDDIYFDETFDTEALERAKAWTGANLGEVKITHDGKTYTVDEFAIRLTDRPDPFLD
jgi:hypothetical protein